MYLIRNRFMYETKDKLPNCMNIGTMLTPCLSNGFTSNSTKQTLLQKNVS